ncbi:MAG: AAA family ATPase [Duncaniella sp.]|jgi:hypothetical protein
MDNINIHINELGPIRDAQLDIRPLMIFTGESGLGKSYLAFLSNYIFALLAKGSTRLTHFFDDIDFSTILDGKKSGDIIYSLPIKDLFEWIDRDAVNYVAYMIGNTSLTGSIHIEWPAIDEIDEYIDFSYSEVLSGLDNSEELSYRIATRHFNYNSISDKKDATVYVFTTLIKAELFRAVFIERNLFSFQNIILPPSRGALMEIQDTPVFRSGMYESFYTIKSDIARPVKQQKDEDPILSKLLEKINEGTITQNDNSYTYTTIFGVKLPLSAAASSIKEIAPLTMLLDKYEISKMAILFEEPEAHLHPSRQQFVADLIGYMVSNGCNMQVTTHSDYFIKRINALIKLYPIISQLPAEDGQELLAKHGFNQESLIDTANVIAYNLTRNDNGYTNVSQLKTDAEEGVPFDSFHKVITRYFDLLSDLNDIGNNTNDEE